MSKQLTTIKKRLALLVLFVLFLLPVFNTAFAQQETPSLVYIPIIGITSVPDPLALPDGPGDVTYHYAVKSFLEELPLQGVSVIDNSCSPIVFVTGDDNGDSLLNHNETWRYTCTTQLTQTTKSKATATGHFNNVSATHNAFATVVVGDVNPAPIVSVINVSKIAYPLSLPAEGGDITFTYKVNNPGVVPLSFVRVSDEKCTNMSNKLGDTNGNNLLDPNEVWTYTCVARLTETTTNTVKVSAYANGVEALDEHTITVRVDQIAADIVPLFPNTGASPKIKFAIWQGLIITIVALAVIRFSSHINKQVSNKKRSQRNKR